MATTFSNLISLSLTRTPGVTIPVTFVHQLSLVIGFKSMLYTYASPNRAVPILGYTGSEF